MIKFALERYDNSKLISTSKYYKAKVDRTKWENRQKYFSGSFY